VNTTELENYNLDDARGRIFIIGFMGTGKTHWGSIWAARHHCLFIDLDEEIERDEQLSISDIFEKRGEDYFRQKEAVMLRQMQQYSNAVIACGGGTPCFFDNMKWMNENGLSVLLQAAPAAILQNILVHEGKRPLVKNLNEAELLFYIEQKLSERKNYYEEAIVKLNAEAVTEQSIDSLIKPIE
jgi:shikimate kinase